MIGLLVINGTTETIQDSLNLIGLLRNKANRRWPCSTVTQIHTNQSRNGSNPTGADKDDSYTYTTALDFFDDAKNYEEETGNDT